MSAYKTYPLLENIYFDFSLYNNHEHQTSEKGIPILLASKQEMFLGMWGEWAGAIVVSTTSYHDYSRSC